MDLEKSELLFLDGPAPRRWVLPWLRAGCGWCPSSGGHPGGCADPAGRGSHGNPVDADVWSCPPASCSRGAVTHSCCYSRLWLGFILFVYFRKKEGTFSLSFAQSFPFTVSKTTELDAKAGAVGTSVGEVSPACVSHQMLAFRIPWRSRCCTGAAAERGKCERWESFGSKAEWD